MFVSDKNFLRKRRYTRTTNLTKKQLARIVLGIFPRHFRANALFAQIQIDQGNFTLRVCCEFALLVLSLVRIFVVLLKIFPG